jgi:hypothetical protein
MPVSGNSRRATAHGRAAYLGQSAEVSAACRSPRSKEQEDTTRHAVPEMGPQDTRVEPLGRLRGQQDHKELQQ